MSQKAPGVVMGRRTLGVTRVADPAPADQAIGQYGRQRTLPLGRADWHHRAQGNFGQSTSREISGANCEPPGPARNRWLPIGGPGFPLVDFGGGRTRLDSYVLRPWGGTSRRTTA
jgi:hypothetical protein